MQFPRNSQVCRNGKWRPSNGYQLPSGELQIGIPVLNRCVGIIPVTALRGSVCGTGVKRK